VGCCTQKKSRKEGVKTLPPLLEKRNRSVQSCTHITLSRKAVQSARVNSLASEGWAEGRRKRFFNIDKRDECWQWLKEGCEKEGKAKTLLTCPRRKSIGVVVSIKDVRRWRGRENWSLSKTQTSHRAGKTTAPGGSSPVTG